MNNNLEFENEDPCPDSIEDNHPRTNYGEGYEVKETFFRVLCNQNNIYMGFGHNSESKEQLAQSYLTYKSINWDSEETEAYYRSLPCEDIIALMLNDEFEIEQSNAPFEELE